MKAMLTFDMDTNEQAIPLMVGEKAMDISNIKWLSDALPVLRLE